MALPPKRLLLHKGRVEPMVQALLSELYPVQTAYPWRRDAPRVRLFHVQPFDTPEEY